MKSVKPKRESLGRIAKKVKPKTVKFLRKKAWSLLSEIIRRKYSDHTGRTSCYTCDLTDFWQELQAGHGIGGRHNAVLLDESIIRPQCPRCNIFLRGNYPVFTTKLIKENGLDWWEEKLAQSRQRRMYTRGELHELIDSYRIRLKELREGGERYLELPSGAKMLIVDPNKLRGEE